MASAPIRLGLKYAGGHGNSVTATKVVLSTKFGQLNSFSAGITGKTARGGERPPKPEPWPYKEKGYSNWTFWIDKTLKRFDLNTRLITVEGPPAAGKTKVAKAIAEELEFKYMPMVTMDYYYMTHDGYDIRAWEDKMPHGHKTCDESVFIKNPNHHLAQGMIFGLFLLKHSQYIDALAHIFNTGQGVVMERCVHSDLAFFDAHHRVGYLNKLERKGINELRKLVLPDLLRPHLVVYLDASVDTVLSNFKKRGLGEEKTFPAEFLKELEISHKQRVLPEMERHAHLLAYDWNDPGDVEAIVEDIERLDFESFTHHSVEKMKDWRFDKDEQASEQRWRFTHTKERMLNVINQANLLDCPRLFGTGEDMRALETLLDEFPGARYFPGWDPQLGDKYLFRVSEKNAMILPDIVSDYLEGKIPKPPALPKNWDPNK